MASFNALYETTIGLVGKSQREKRDELISFYKEQFMESHRAKIDNETKKMCSLKQDLSQDPTWVKLTTELADMNSEYFRLEQALERLEQAICVKDNELVQYERKHGVHRDIHPVIPFFETSEKIEYDKDTTAKIKRVNDLYKADRDAV
jgi:hypothetical protein